MKGSLAFVTVWAHPQKAHYSTLVEAACKLVLLDDSSVDWVYAFVWLNEGLSHAPLSSKGHVSAIMDGMPCEDAHSHLHQLQVCKLLQHKDLVVCLEGLNGEMEASQFTFQELSLWDATTPGKPICKPQPIEVNLRWHAVLECNNLHPDPQTIPILPLPPVDTAKPSSAIAAASQPAAHRHPGMTAAGFPCCFSLCLPVQQAQETVTICSSGGSTSGRRIGRSPQARGDRLHHPHPNGNPHEDIFAGDHFSWHPQLCPSHSSTAAANSAEDTWGGGHLFCHMASSPLQGGTSLPVWWATSATGENEHDPRAITHKQGHQGFLAQRAELNAELAACLNDAQFAKAIKEAEVCHATTACAPLQQAHGDSVLMLEHEAKVEEGWDCQAFVEAFGVSHVHEPVCPRHCGALLYPLQLLNGNVPLATILGMLATAKLQAVADRGYNIGSGRQGVSTDTSHPKCTGDSSATGNFKMLALFLGPRHGQPWDRMRRT